MLYGEFKLKLVRKIKSYKDLLTDDWSQVSVLSHAELSAYVDYLSRIANRRLTDIENAEKKYGYHFMEASPAYRAVQEKDFLKTNENGKNRFFYKGLNINQLRRMYSELNTFLKAKTSTLEGIAEYKVKQAEREGLDVVDNKKTYKKLLTDYLDVENNKKRILSKDEEDMLWDVYNKLKDNKDLAEYSSGQAQSDIVSFIRNKKYSAYDVEDYYYLMKDYIKSEYERIEAERVKGEEKTNEIRKGVRLQ